MEIGESIKKFRENKGLTQKQLGELIGVTAVTITRYENEKRSPDIKTLIKIATALEILITDLLEGDSEIAYVVEKIDLLDKVLNHCGYFVESAQIGDEEFGINIKSKDVNVTISTYEYDVLFDSIKKSIDFELYKLNEKDPK